MPSAEYQPERFRTNSEPLNPSPLPPELAEFLKDRPVACLLHETDTGTVFIIKVPARDIQSVRGRVPTYLRHELYDDPAAPVIRTLIPSLPPKESFYD